MRLPRVRLTVRCLMVTVALAALILAAGMAFYDRYFSTPVTKAYYIGDLIPVSDRGPSGTTDMASDATDMEGVVGRLTSVVTPDVWWSPRRAAFPFFLSKSVIVRHSGSGHQQVSSWLRRQRHWTRVNR